MNLNKQILMLADEYEAYAIACRRKVHQFAEVAGTEEKTKAFIIEEIKKLGLPYEEVPTTSIIARLETGRPGKTILLRADIDALPLTECEENLKNPRVCVSEQADTCHACGHDGHTAMLLTAMQLFVHMKEQLCGTLIFCFEEGEERNSGIQAIMKALEKYTIDYCYGMHLYAALDEGKISVDAGPRMAGLQRIDMTFIGKSGHGSRPDLAANPLFCAANMLNNLCVAFNNQITAGETVTMGITQFKAGTIDNLIDDTAYIAGTFRFFSEQEGKKADAILHNVAEHTAAMHKCRVEYGPNSTYRNYPIINDSELSAKADKALRQILPEDAITSCPPWFASESFCFYQERYRGLFVFLGIKSETEGFGAPHHNDRFDFNESVLKTGVVSTARIIAELLSC